MGKWESSVEIMGLESNKFTFLRDKVVFLTGHSGFKGSWMAHVLSHFGAKVCGFSDRILDFSHFTQSNSAMLVESVIGDVRSKNKLDQAMNAANPDFIIHMAAQALVRRSYEEPAETFETNVMGTVNVLDLSRNLRKKPLVAIITTDKCYENVGKQEPYRETDPMGGSDAYSASKGASELAAASFGRSFFTPNKQKLMTLRGGNVIGGGDWSEDRIMTDVVNALSSAQPIVLRNPTAIRPWQHVLDVISGYLSAMEYHYDSKEAYFDAFNIGPKDENHISVEELARQCCQAWGVSSEARLQIVEESNKPEALLLKLDITKALRSLDWQPALDMRKAICDTIEWYKSYFEGQCMHSITQQQIKQYFGGDKS